MASLQIGGGSGAERTITLIITDLRQCSYSAGHFQQKDYTINFVPTNDGKSNFSLLKEMIDKALPSPSPLKGRNKRNINTKYEICNPDTRRIDETDVAQLAHNSHLILLEPKQTTFPITYNRVCSTVPHTRAITNQDGKFYGSEDHNRAALAIAELIDNSLSATCGNGSNKEIEIRFYDNDNPTIAILDNGSGMDSHTLETSLIYKAPKESRPISTPSASTAVSVHSHSSTRSEQSPELIHPLYINSNISKFGAGMKQAIFWLGDKTTIMTKTANTEQVSQVELSKEEMEEKESKQRAEAWSLPIHMGEAGKLRGKDGTCPNPIVQTITAEEEPGKSSFTHIIVENIHDDMDQDSSPLQLLRKLDHPDTSIPSFEKQLAHIYHYYLHGRNFEQNENVENVNIIVKRFDQAGRIVSEKHLRKISDDLESQFILTAAPCDPFLFTIVASSDNAKTINISGIIRYHPFLYDHETIPLRNFLRGKKSENGESDDNDGNTENPFTAPQTAPKIFHVFWNGRLIPHTKLGALNWCQPNKRSDSLFKSYNRISGSLFLDSGISEITENKLHFATTTKLMDLLNMNTQALHINSITTSISFQRIKRDKKGSLRAERVPKAGKVFEGWLTECQKFDKEVLYSKILTSDGLPVEKKVGTKTYIQYGTAKWDKFVLSKGDAVTLLKKVDKDPTTAGIIQSFYVDKDNCITTDPASEHQYKKTLHAPESYFIIEWKPAACYQESSEWMEMRFIDKKVSSPKANKIIMEQMKDLKQFKLIVDPDPQLTDPNFKDGMQVAVDGVLFEFATINIVKDNDGTSLHGFLPFYKNKASKKPIYVTFRIHRILPSGNWELQRTSAVCKYGSTFQGYGFEKFSLTEIEDGAKIGEYVVTFRSYIDVREDWTGSTNSHPGRPHLRKTTRPRGRRSASLNVLAPNPESEFIDPPYESEWEMEVDTVGRKILNDGEGNLIRMPFHQINFSVVAGAPDKFHIEESDRIYCIGKPFDITLSFKDSLGNKTILGNLESITSQKLQITLNSNKENPEDLTFTHRELFAAEENVVIKDVVAAGNLGRIPENKTALKIQLDLNGKTKSRYKDIIFYPGLPHKIVSLGGTIDLKLTMENGKRPMMACQLLDAYDNKILYSWESQQNGDTKRIMLDCSIYKYFKNEANRIGELVLKTKIPVADQERTSACDRVILPDLKTGQCLKVTLVCIVEYPGIEPVQVFVDVTPSTRPDMMILYQIFDTESGRHSIPIENESELKGELGSELTLRVEILDGLGRPVEFDPKNHKINVNWAKGRARSDILPKLKIPLRSELKKCMATTLRILQFEEEPLEHTFYLSSHPLEPSGLHASWLNHGKHVSLRVGEKVPDVLLKISDRHGNIISDFRGEDQDSYVEILADGFSINFKVEEPEEGEEGISLIVKNVRITPDSGSASFLPLVELCLSATFYQQFSDTFNITVTPGPPEKLVPLIEGRIIKSRGTFTTSNGTSVRICAQFCDVAQNHTVPDTPVRVTFKMTSINKNTITVTEPRLLRESNVRNDGDGVADFGIVSTKITPSPVNTPRASQCNKCNTGKCYGKAVIGTIEAQYGGKIISEIVYFHITKRSDFPHHLLIDIGRNKEGFSYEAGSYFEQLSATLLAEDESKCKTAEKESLHLKLTAVDSPTQQFNLTAAEVNQGVFTFGEVPIRAGEYKTEFIYDNNSVQNICKAFKNLEIYPGPIHTFQPDKELANLSVSNDPANAENRVIVQELKLVLKDKYGNSVRNDDAIGSEVHLEFLEQLQLENYNQTSRFPIINGAAIIPKLSVPPGLNLRNGTKHFIKFIAKLGNNIHSRQLEYNLEFTFYNNTLQQQNIIRVQSEIQNAAQELTNMGEEINNIKDKIGSLQKEQKDLERSRDSVKGMLPPQVASQLNTVSDIMQRETVLKNEEARLEAIWKQNKSNITPGPGSGEEHVLGRIGLLAEIKSEGRGMEQDLNVQKVLSWHLQNRLDVIVTETAEKGRSLERNHPNQQFMLLDIVKGFSRPANEPLTGAGNPIFARNLLQFAEDKPAAALEKVFNNILGNTVLIDNIDDAIKFMRHYNQERNTQCPTILTREDGRRLTPSGIVGGSNNSVPRNGCRYKMGIAPSPALVQIRSELPKLFELKKALHKVEEGRGRNGLQIEQFTTQYDKWTANWRQLSKKRDDLLKQLESLQAEVPGPAKSGLSRQTRSSNTVSVSPPETKRQRMNDNQ